MASKAIAVAKKNPFAEDEKALYCFVCSEKMDPISPLRWNTDLRMRVYRDPTLLPILQKAMTTLCTHLHLPENTVPSVVHMMVRNAEHNLAPFACCTCFISIRLIMDLQGEGEPSAMTELVAMELGKQMTKTPLLVMRRRIRKANKNLADWTVFESILIVFFSLPVVKYIISVTPPGPVGGVQEDISNNGVRDLLSLD